MPAWTDASRQIDAKLEVFWDGATWADESANLISASGKQSILPFWQIAGGAAVQPPWTASFQLRSTSDRYSPLNSSSPIYSDIQTNLGYGVPIRFSAGLWNGSSYDYTRIFTGYIDNLALSSTQNNRATISAVDNTHAFFQQKSSNEVSQDKRTDEWLTTLANLANVGSTSFDTGLQINPYSWLDDENVWTEMNKVAHGEAGWIYFDRNGVLQFKNNESLVVDTVHKTSQHTFSVSRLRDIAMAFDWRNVYNQIIVIYSPRKEDITDVIYTLPEAFTLSPGEARVVTTRYRRPALSINTPVANTDYHIIDPSGNDLSGSVALVTDFDGQRGTLTFTNNHTTKLAIVADFTLSGVPLIGSPSQQEEQSVNSDIGDATSGTGHKKTFRVEGNEYLQTRAQAAFLTAILSDRLKTARQTYIINGARMIPTLEPGYRVTAAETGSGLNNECFILDVSWSYGRAWTANYTLINADGWTPYTAYFEMGTDTLNDTTSDRAYY